MKALTCIIVEDEFPARALLQNYIEETPELELLKSFRDPVLALRYLDDFEVSLIFLDIQMPAMTGLDFIKELGYKPAIVLTTAYQDYAYEGYQLEVIDYLLKPFTQARFHQAVAKVIKWVGTGTDNQQTERIVKSGYSLQKIAYDSIIFIEGMREYVRYHTTEGKFMELVALKALEGSLPYPMFKRIHKSYIVNYKYVNRLDSGYLEVGSEKIPIGQTYRDEVISWFNKK